MHIFEVILIQPILNVLMAIYAIIPGHDFGISVILLTILIRAILWPLASKQLHSQRKLQSLQPEIARVKKQAAGNKQKENELMMELYKEKEINPFGACLPLLLQLPVLFAMFYVFKTTTHFDQLLPLLYAPVKNLPYMQQVIANPSMFNPTLFGWISMTQPNHVLAVIAGISQYIQVWMITPKVKPDPGDSQAQTQRIMNYMFPLVTVVFAWNLMAALPLYWTTTNAVSILQQWLIMRHDVEDMEEAVVVKKKSLPSGDNKKPAKKSSKKKGGKK